MTGRIGVVGSNNIDLVTYIDRMPLRGETLAAPDFEIGFGGKGSNQAVAAARLGANVMMVSRVGDDMFGPRTLENLRQNGIDTRHVKPVANTASGVAPIFVEPNGENSILIIEGANGHVMPADIDEAAPELGKCDLILMQLEIPLETVYYTLEWAAERGIKTVLNPAPAIADLDLSKLDGLSFLAPNEGELALLTGLPTGTEAEIGIAAQSLLAAGIEQVIVTLGDRGARLYNYEGVTRIDSVPVKPVDTTGAGDAFIGSFAAFLAQGSSVENALKQASLYAALSITRRGAQKSYATPSEFAAFVQNLEL